jgi:hypothetical protein
MPARIQTVMLKQGQPTVEQARARLNAELDRAAKSGVRVLKLVHGYGASGFGGAIRDAIRRSLRKRVKEGIIACFVAGESWSVFDESARRLLDACPELARDADLNRYNEGMTFVLLKSPDDE